MTFNTQFLANDRVLVTQAGKAKHQAILDGRQWAEIQGLMAYKDASKEYDESVKAFYAPLTEATEKLEAATAAPAADPLFSIVVTEAEQGSATRNAEVYHLTEHSAILRLIEQDPKTDRLIWVNESTLAITKA